MQSKFVLLIGVCALISACNRSHQPIDYPQTTFAHPGSLPEAPPQPVVGQTTRPAPEPAAAEPVESATLELPRVHFAFDSAQILPESRRDLRRTAAALKQQPDVRVQVEGHADERGTPAYNLALGEQRARAVVTELKNLGVHPDQLQILTKGEEEPLMTDGTSNSLAVNRRVEFETTDGRVAIELTRGVLYDDQGKPIAGVPVAGRLN